MELLHPGMPNKHSLDTLMADNISLVSISGKAVTGKTLLALAT